jgi:hypothetical protein
MPAGHGLALLADIPDRQRRDRPPELVVRREHSMIPVPVLPRRRHEICESVEKLKRREFDDASGARLCGLSAAVGSDPVGGFVPRQYVADASDAAASVARHGEPFERKGRPRTVPQQVFQALKVARHVPVEERDPDEKRRLKPRCSPMRACRRRPRQGLAPFVSANGACPFSLLPRRGQARFPDRKRARPRARPAQPGRHDESRAARHADRGGKAEAEEPALEIAADFLLDGARHGPLGSFPPGEPVLEVLQDYSVERRLLWAATLVTP